MLRNYVLLPPPPQRETEMSKCKCQGFREEYGLFLRCVDCGFQFHKDQTLHVPISTEVDAAT